MAKRKLTQIHNATIADHLRDFKAQDWTALVLIVVTIIVTVSQLMTFDKFIPIIRSYYLPFPESSALVAAFIVTAEVFSLPYLLRISLSTHARLISAALGLVTGLVWALLGLWILSAPNNLRSSGLLGSLILLPPGPWMVFGGLVFLAAYIGIVFFREKELVKIIKPSKPKK